MIEIARRLWLLPIASSSQAEEIIYWAGGIACLAGLIGLFYGVVPALAIAPFAISLMRTKLTRWAFWIVRISGFTSSILVIAIIAIPFVKPSRQYAITFFALFLAWALLFFIGLRAKKATEYLSSRGQR